ncbi:MAG TPA: condensation domain-containing protein, partial [Thermoanaerobaculia bacterium]|nr:condensation domain-containing protein [Thermoanaerobaculia bacterium]
RLVAYVVLQEDAQLTLGELRGYLAQRLPDPMVPTAWARLDALPLTATGKLDRRALLAIEPQEGGTDGPGFTPPQTATEEILARIWGEVLGLRQVGRDDDFFALGGHSLLATQVASRAREAFGRSFPLRWIFEAPTLAALANLAPTLTAEEGQAAPPLVRAPRTADLPLSFAQERLWILEQLQPLSAAYNVPLVLRAEGRIEPRRLRAALSALVARHEVLRTVFVERRGAPLQVVSPAAAVALPVVDLGGLTAGCAAGTAVGEKEARRIAVEESARPFDLARGPLLRALLVALGPDREMLFLGLHHIAADGWSLGILVREIRALYASNTGDTGDTGDTGEELPELPIQYADFALWQRRWLSGETLTRQLDWWRERLSGAPGTLELPTDHPRPPLQSQRGAEVRCDLPAELAGGLAELAGGEGATLFMVLATAVFLLLSRLTGQRDLLLGSPIANRSRRELEGLIGFFVNTLALRGDLRRARTCRELLRQVREVSLGAYAHQDLPFEKLVDELQPDRDLSRSPLFQVVLALQNAPLEEADLGGVRLIPEELPGEVAKFDLTLVFVERPGGRLSGSLQYARDLFEAPTAARFARSLQALLRSLAARPESAPAALDLLAPEERHQLLHEWNDTAAPCREETLHGAFERQVDARPEAVAAVFEGIHLTYRALDGAANRLAHLLSRLG